MTDTADHYEVLEIEEDASQREVKKAFYGLLPEHPPEKDQEGFQLIREAYDVLSNPVSRKEYDNMSSYGEEIESLKDEADALMHGDAPDYKAAIPKLKKAVVLGPDIGILRNMLGLCFMRTERYNKALQQFTKATKIDERNEAYWMNKARAFKGLGDFSSAESICRKIWAEDEEDYAAPRLLAQVLNDQERLSEAIDVLDKAIHADGKIDFQDFFCIYDKIHLHLFDGNNDALEEDLETVLEVAKSKADREFASFMLGRSGEQLLQVKAFSVAERFLSAAQELDPQPTPELNKLLGNVQELRKVEDQFKQLQDDDRIHEVVKYMMGVYVRAAFGIVDIEKHQSETEEIVMVLENVMSADPDATEIKQSLRRTRQKYRSVYDTNNSFFQSIIDLSRPQYIGYACPHCDAKIRSEKGRSGTMGCPQCRKQFYSDGESYRKHRWGTSSSTKTRSKPNTKSKSTSSDRPAKTGTSTRKTSSAGASSGEGMSAGTVIGGIIFLLFMVSMCG